MSDNLPPGFDARLDNPLEARFKCDTCGEEYSYLGSEPRGEDMGECGDPECTGRLREFFPEEYSIEPTYGE